MIEFCNNNQGFITVMSTIVMAVLTMVYVIASIFQVRTGQRSNQIALENNNSFELLEQERVRPFIFCQLYFHHSLICFAVSNNGTTIAKNIKFSFCKPIYSFLNDKKIEIAFLRNGIASLPPGQKLDVLLGQFAEFRKEYEELKIECAVSYQSIFGKMYVDSFVLDVSYADSRVHLIEKGIHDIAKELEGTRKTLNHLVSGYHKPHIIVQDIESKRADDQAFLDEHYGKKSDIIIPDEKYNK